MKNKKIKKRRIKWGNIGLLIVLLFCIGLVAHDIYMIAIQPWINGKMAGWTWFGFGTFILAIFVGGTIIEYFIDEINKK